MSYHLLDPSLTLVSGGGQPWQQPSFSLLSGAHPQPNYHLVPSLSLTPYQPPAAITSVALGALPALPDLNAPPGIGLVTGTFKELVKMEEIDLKIPNSLKTIGTVFSAAHTAEKLVKNIDGALDEGQSPAEAYVCQTAKTLTEEFAGKALKGMIVGGIPPYLAAAASSPALAVTVPFVLPQIPPAYQMAQGTAKGLGSAAESICHSGFDAARKLTNKGE